MCCLGLPTHQASLSFTISWSLLKLMSIELVMLRNHIILYCPLLLFPLSFPASGSFPMSWLFASGGQSIGSSASASVLPMNIQGRFPLGWTGWISLLSPCWSGNLCSLQWKCGVLTTGSPGKSWNENSYLLLTRVYTGTTSLENSLAVSTKAKDVKPLC